MLTTSVAWLLPQLEIAETFALAYLSDSRFSILGRPKPVCGFGFGIHIIVFDLVFTMHDRPLYKLEVAVS